MPRAKNPAAEDAEALVEFQEVMAPATAGAEQRDSAWLVEHYAELVEKYPMSWVAIQDQQVVGHGMTPNQAMNRALERLGEDDHKPEDEEYEAGKHAKNAPHLYVLERSAEWFLEH